MKLKFDFMKEIEFSFPFEGAPFEKLKNNISAVMMRQKDKLFQKSKDPKGNPWAPLSEGTVVQRKKTKSRLSEEQVAKRAQKNPNYASHKILVDKGTLKNSITAAGAPGGISTTSGNEVALGTNVPYARIHNFGGTIERRSGMGNVTITIPARPFIGFGDEDNKQIQELVGATAQQLSVKR